MLIKIGKFKKHLDILYWLQLKPVAYVDDSLIFFVNTLYEYYIAEEMNLILMKLIFFQIGI